MLFEYQTTDGENGSLAPCDLFMARFNAAKITAEIISRILSQQSHFQAGIC